jgi:hypothetical protein
VNDTKQNLRLTDDKTSSAFKAKWGKDAIKRFWDAINDPMYFVQFDPKLIEDIGKEKEALAHGVNLDQLEENDFFLNPDKAWQHQQLT